MIISMLIYRVTKIEGDIKFVLYAVLLVIFVFLFRDLIRTDYIIVKDKKVTIRNLIKTRSFDMNKIHSISISYHPLRRSYFLLDDGKKYKFDAWSLDKNELPKLKLINPNVT